MDELLRQGRAWIPVLKTALLFVLPLPLLLAFVVALVTGDVIRLGAITAALAAFFAAGVLTWRGLVAQARYYLGQRLDPPVVPLKAVGAALTAIGTGFAAAAGGYGVAAIAVFAALAGAGYMCFYGRDARPKRVTVANIKGVDHAAVTAQLKQAYGRLQGIEAAARSIAVPEFVARLERIIDIGKRILLEIERDPREASRARRFLNLYLDSAERVTAEYARTHRQILSRPLERNFRQLLIDMEQTFEAQHRKLLDNDTLSLELEIEVLNARLKHEGVG
ncbi:MAG: 5-bromo-4-chloroindolyl phosphate hydrolysis family protein [Pseudomonadales bacterium]